MLQICFIIPQIGFEFDSIKRKKVSIMLHVCRNNVSRSESSRAIPGMKPGSNRNETGQHPEWARCDRSSSEKLGSELARSGSEFLGATRSSSDGHYTVTTQSLHGHYVVTTRSLHAFLFKGPLGATPAKPSKQKLLTEKTWQRQGLISSSRSAKIREPASAIKLKPSNKLDCKIRRVYAVFRRI